MPSRISVRLSVAIEQRGKGVLPRLFAQSHVISFPWPLRRRCEACINYNPFLLLFLQQLMAIAFVEPASREGWNCAADQFLLSNKKTVKRIESPSSWDKWWHGQYPCDVMMTGQIKLCRLQITLLTNWPERNYCVIKTTFDISYSSN